MSSLDPFVNCLNERVAGGPFKLSEKITSSFRDKLISELYKNSGNFTLNDFLDFLKIFSVDLDDKNKKIIGDLSKSKDRKWWADVLGMDLESDLDKLIVRDYEAIFNPGKKRLMGFQIQGKVRGLKDCLNEELELKKPRGSPLSGVSSPDLSSEFESEPELEPEPEPVPLPVPASREDEERRWDPELKGMYTQREFEENYGDTKEWEMAAPKSGIHLLKDPEWTYKSLGLGRNKKTKKRKKRKKKTKKTKKKKTKKRIKR
tara:strand:+ start:125 stop:904 length:780 start_codon:yes stop_codon:yes gene_type:complete